MAFETSPCRWLVTAPLRPLPTSAAEALRRGFSETGPTEATLLLYAQNRHVYRQITSSPTHRDSDGHIDVMALLRRSLDAEILEPTPERRASPPAREKPGVWRPTAPAKPVRDAPTTAARSAAEVQDKPSTVLRPAALMREESAAAPRLENLETSAPSSAPAPTRTRIFISYSHADAEWLKRLQKHLKPLQREGIEVWDDTRLKAGVQWREEIRHALAAAKVAVLLVSADFLASEFIVTNELPPLLKAAEEEGATILPVIISASRFDRIENLSRFQAVNAPSKPLVKMRRANQEEVLDQVARAVEDALKA